MKEKPLVSIITPVYNCEKLIEETIKSVINQTYSNWEMILVDDCTLDKSFLIIQKYMKKDNRIKYFKLKENSGAAVARNKALKESKGRFIAYLDADDKWKKNKLEKQVNFMLENNYAFTCTDYEKIDEKGNSLKIVKIPKKVNYNLFLRNTIIQTVGVMVDTKITGKDILYMPNIRRRQDAATWCQLLKSGYDCYEVPEVLSYYRVVSNSLSSNKLKAIKMNWYWYRKIEKLSLWKTCYCFIGYAFNAVKKRIYIKR
ncbi:MAG: glycosyltransferase family 2 protein [Bacilli bacterium]|nr:glycosyltransferase family 2 protein [Bacilli bacterium]